MSSRASPGRVERLAAHAAPGARCWSRCRRTRTTRRRRAAPRRRARPSASGRCPGRRGSRAPRAVPSPSCGRPRTRAGFSPMTYSVRSSPRSIASNICGQVPAVLRNDRDAPGLLELRSRLGVLLDVLEARAACSGSRPCRRRPARCSARAAGCSPEPVAADVPGQQRQVDQREHVVDRVVMLGDPERPAQDRAVGAARRRAPVRGSPPPGRRSAARPPRACTARPRPRTPRSPLVALRDERARRSGPLDDLARDRVRERDVGADVEPEPQVGPLRRRASAADR